MAIYHFSGQIISRSQGRSSVAAGAYRAAEKIQDERTELVHDFTKKEHDIIHKEIILSPKAPQRFSDRKTLWNEIERVEKRKDAQLCREINISLPRELNHDENIQLTREFALREFVSKGMIADICIHQGKEGEQPHAHIMLTLREVDETGFGKKQRAWNDKSLLLEWREKWAEIANRRLYLAGHDIKIDHRSYEEQGINLEPQTKIGPKCAQNRLEEHQQIARENGERILEDPTIALDAITRQQSTFTHHDLARFVNRHTADREQFTSVYTAVKTNKEIVNLGLDDQGRERFTTKEMLNLEHRMLDTAVSKAGQGQHPVNPNVQADIINASSLTDEQTRAYQHITANKDMVCVIGFAGTGKSYMLGEAREAWEQSGYNTVGMALSGIAAENLEGNSGIKSRTAASHLLSWENDREHLTSKDVVVIDEAGMLGSRQMAKVLDEVSKANAKTVLVLDPEQLPAIEAGAPARAIAERIGYVEMRDIKRQQESWQKDATVNFGTGRTLDSLLAYEEHNHVHAFNNKEMAMSAMVEQWDESRSNQPDKSLLMIAYTRDEVRELNERAREARNEASELGQAKIIETSLGNKEFAAGDRIYFLRNEYRDLNVKNGTLGTIQAIEEKNITVQIDSSNAENRTITFNTEQYNHIDHGYAATAYKAQGSTVDRSFVLASQYFDRHSSYVAMTRHKESADLFWSKGEFANFTDVADKFSRERSKDIVLDYADARNFDISEDLIEREYKREYPALTEQKTEMQVRLDMAEERAQQRLYSSGLEQLNLKADAAGLTDYSKQALTAEKEFKQLEQRIETSLFPNAMRGRLEEYATKVSKQPELMQQIKEHNADLFKQIEQAAKSCEQSKEMGLSLER